jgi:hypothetical protein
MHTRTIEDFSEAPCEERIAVVNEVAGPEQESVFAIRPVSSDLTHPSAVGRADDSGNLDLMRLEVDHEEREVPNETPPRDAFDGEDSRGTHRSPQHSPLIRRVCAINALAARR